MESKRKSFLMVLAVMTFFIFFSQALAQKVIDIGNLTSEEVEKSMSIKEAETKYKEIQMKDEESLLNFLSGERKDYAIVSTSDPRYALWFRNAPDFKATRLAFSEMVPINNGSSITFTRIYKIYIIYDK